MFFSILSSAKFKTEHLFSDENKEKRPGLAHVNKPRLDLGKGTVNIHLLIVYQSSKMGNSNASLLD